MYVCMYRSRISIVLMDIIPSAPYPLLVYKGGVLTVIGHMIGHMCL